jgi:hypothetical protein
MRRKKMIIQPIDPNYFDQKTQRIRAAIGPILKRWGLLPRFKRWRLTQDPNTGMVVLFGILNNKYIATHTSIPFSDYFDPRLLNDLATELQVQIVSCNSDGLRYAFVLERGQIDILPTHIDYPFIEGDRLSARVVYSDKFVAATTEPQGVHVSLTPDDIVNDQVLVRQGVGAFLKVFDDIKLREDAATLQSSAPNILMIDENEFNKRVAEHEAGRQRRLNALFDAGVG